MYVNFIVWSHNRTKGLTFLKYLKIRFTTAKSRLRVCNKNKGNVSSKNKQGLTIYLLIMSQYVSHFCLVLYYRHDYRRYAHCKSDSKLYHSFVGFVDFIVQCV